MRMLKTLLSTSDVAYATSTKELFSHVSVTVSTKDRIGLLGNNGTGKSSLLKLLTGHIEPDNGTVIKNGTFGYVPQIPNEDDTNETLAELLATKDCSYNEFSLCYKSIFSANIPDPETKLCSLSGGERTKLWIALVGAKKPSILFLDEPTNHLDEKSINELGKWLRKLHSAVVFVSHNESFLTKNARTIWELNAGSVSVFGSGYTDFLKQKKHLKEAQARQYEASKKGLAALRSSIRMRETRAARAEKVQRQSKTDTSRSKSAEDYFHNRSEKGIGKMKKKHDTERIEIEKSIEQYRPAKLKTVNVPLETSNRTGNLILDIQNLSISIDSRELLSDVALRIEHGDRLAITGDNGTGKTLLVKKLMTEIEHPTLETSRVGTNIQTAYIDQKYDIVDLQLTIFENLERSLSSIDQQRIYKQIGRFQFPEHAAHRKAHELSGGELARLAFAMTTIEPLDLLILDEPTNNLDIETISVIVEALNDFQGSLIVISHDTSFLQKLKVQKNYRIEHKRLTLD